jgi:hypothetical protein
MRSTNEIAQLDPHPLNGVVVQDNIELPNSTTASMLKEGPDPGPIDLQEHGAPVRYRNIWVLEK